MGRRNQNPVGFDFRFGRCQLLGFIQQEFWHHATVNDDDPETLCSIIHHDGTRIDVRFDRIG